MLSSSLVKAQVRSRSSQTIASIGNVSVNFVVSTNRLHMDAQGNFYFRGSNGSENTIYKYTASTGAITSVYTLSSVVNWGVDSAGVVYFNYGPGGDNNVYAVGGSYGASPVVIFTSPWTVGGLCFAVKKDGTAIYLTEISNGSSQNLVKYSAWSGGTATSNLINTGFSSLTGSPRPNYADTFGNVYAGCPSPEGPFPLVKCTPGGTVTSLSTSYIATAGLAFDESSKYLYVPQSNVLYEVDSVSGNATGVTFSVSSLGGVATTASSRSIYVLSGGTSASIIALAPNY